MSEHIKPFNPELENCAQRWVKWVNRFKLFIEVKEIADPKKQINNLLYYAGEQVSETYETTKTVTADTKLEEVIEKLTKVFNPESNHTINRYKFRATKQHEEEPFDEFMERLKAVAQSCKFADTELEFKHQIIYGCFSDKLRSRAMEDEKLTLENLLKMAKTIELVDGHMDSLNKQKISIETVNQVGYGKFKRNEQNACSNRGNHVENKVSGMLHNKPNKICYRCGGSFPHEKNKTCPAKGKTCTICKKSLQQFADPFQKNTHHETSSTKLMHFWMNTII